MESKIKVLVLNIGWEQEPLIERLFQRGFKVYGVHYSETYNHTYPYEEVLVVSNMRELESILSFAESKGVDFVISDECDYSHFSQAFVAENLGVPGPSIKNAQISSNKFLQRTLAQERGVKVPEFALVASKKDIYDFTDRVGYPVIIKPVDNRGSFGVIKINDESEIKSAYREALSNSHSRLALIEKFIEGYEITVDGYCFPQGVKSLGIARKSKEGLEVQVSMDIKYPADMDFKLKEVALRNNEFVNTQLGYEFGMTHSEYLITKDEEIYLVESANRGGGAFTSQVILPETSGINIIDRYIDDVCGQSKPLENVDSAHNSVILKFFSFPEGKVKKIEGFEKVLKHPNVLKSRIIIAEGDYIKPIQNDGNRHGFVIVKSDDNVREVANKIIKLINIIYY